ncbi:MAG TPA: hypothetical protein VGH80_04240 [Xanthomonadaceae bacterium]|jgi:hypothetical protein
MKRIGLPVLRLMGHWGASIHVGWPPNFVTCSMMGRVAAANSMDRAVGIFSFLAGMAMVAQAEVWQATGGEKSRWPGISWKTPAGDADLCVRQEKAPREAGLFMLP